MDLPVVLAMTGASGAVYGLRLLEVLLAAGRETHLTISDSAAEVLRVEMGLPINLSAFNPAQLVRGPTERLRYWHHRDFSAGIASGSFRTAGMAVAPCSMNTLAAIAHGLGTNLICRAAEVHLKERRKLILTCRETPLSLSGVENMAAAIRAGAIVLPAMPGFYHQPKTIEDLVDFVVARICDQLGVEVDLTRRWGE